MAIEIVDFPIKHGDFSIVMLVYQRVTLQMVQVMHGKKILKKNTFFMGPGGDPPLRITAGPWRS